MLRITTATMLTTCVFASAVQAGRPVSVLSDAGRNVIEGEFLAGDVITVRFSLRTSGDAPIFAVNWSAFCGTDDIQIRSVRFHDAFPILLDGQEPQSGVSNVHVVRSQALRGFDSTLGSSGASVPFALVEIEILQDEYFESALLIDSQVSMLGERPGSTSVLAKDSNEAESMYGPGMVVIINTAGTYTLAGDQPGGIEADGGQPDVGGWTIEEGDVVFDVLPVGGGAPQVDLTAHTTYELHYSAATQDVNGYALFSITDSVEQGFGSAERPAIGEWSNTGLFVRKGFSSQPDPSLAAQGFADGYYRFYYVGDDQWPCDVACAAPQGHLCDFTTRDPGALFIELIMYQDDFDTQSSVEMHSIEEYAVLPGS